MAIIPDPAIIVPAGTYPPYGAVKVNYGKGAFQTCAQGDGSLSVTVPVPVGAKVRLEAAGVALDAVAGRAVEPAKKKGKK